MQRHHGLTVCVVFLGVALMVSCGHDATGPSVGAIDVAMAMVGPASDPDGATVSVDGGTPTSIFAGEAKSFTDLVTGSHAVRLDGLAAGCTVAGDNPAIVTVESGRTAEVRFDVNCEASATTGEDPLAVLLSGGTYEKVQPMDSVTEVDSLTEQRDDGTWSCTVQRRSAVEAPADYATFDPNAEVIYPGSMLQGATLVNATPEPIAVARAGGTFVINLLNGSSGVAQSVDEVKQSTVIQAINDILAANTGIVPARFTFTSNQVQSREQMALEMGVNVSTLSFDFNGHMAFSTDQTYNRFLVQMTQSYYTVSFDLPRSVHDLIAPGVTGADVAPYVGPGNPATYISSVTYGRRYYLLIESTSSVTDMASAIQASYDAAVVGGSMAADVAYVKDLKNVDIKVFALGGDQSLALATFNGDFNAIRDFLTQGADIRTAVPLSYVVRNVADNTIVNVKVATDYDVKTCVPMQGNLLFSGFTNDGEGWSSYGNGNGDGSAVVHWGQATCAGGMGGCIAMVDYLSETNTSMVAQTMYYRAPWSWRSNMSWADFYGGSISFHFFYQWGLAGQPPIAGWLDAFKGPIPSLLIAGQPGDSLYLQIPDDDYYQASIGWTLYSVPLDTTQTPYGYWQYNGHRATEQEMRSVLDEVTDFRIRGDILYGTDLCWLDGVSVEGPDSP